MKSILKKLIFKRRIYQEVKTVDSSMAIADCSLCDLAEKNTEGSTLCAYANSRKPPIGPCKPWTLFKDITIKTMMSELDLLD